MTADRDSNRTSSLAWKSLLLLTFASVGFMAQLPPEIEADRYMLRAESAIEEQDYARARGAMEKVLELQSEHDLEIPVEVYFKYADVLQHSHAPRDALEMILRYLQEAGREGESYMAALKLMERVEREIEEAERQRVARAEREARETRVAAIREGAAKELPSEIRAMDFVRIPAGRFRMGSKDGGLINNEEPVRQVRISRDFELGRYEVTQLEWSSVMGGNPSDKLCQRCPVTDVSWNDVQEFIGILNQATGQGRPYRLPTEAEWEYAARAGTTGEWYASDADAIMWYFENSDIRSHPVGEKAPNAFGLHDMLGNVAEWVQDWFGEYARGRVTDPVGPSAGSSRAIRGGSYWRFKGTCRASARDGQSPSYRENDLGFRLARTVQ